MKIFVTGGAGFIGSAVIRHIIKNTQDNIVNLDKLTNVGRADSEVGRASARHDGLKADLQTSYKSLITYVTDRPRHDRRYAIDASKIEKNLGGSLKKLFKQDYVKRCSGIWIINAGANEYKMVAINVNV